MALTRGILRSNRFWTGVGLAATTLAAVGVREGLRRGWKKVEDEDPPDNPAVSDVSWRKALTWAVIAGAAAGAGRVVASRGTAFLRKRVGA